MAHSDKNIVITPARSSSTVDPRIVFSGADASTGPQNITITAYPANGGTLSVDGSAGQLFSVSNSLTGTLFAVNDISGIPSIEVLDTGVVKLAQYGGNVLIGVAAPVGTSSNTTASVTFARSYNWFAITDSMYVQRSNNTDGPVFSFHRGPTAVGSITVTSTATSYVTSSDERLKKNIVPASSAIAKLNAIQVRSFDWNADDSHVQHGFIAQELVNVEPAAVVQGRTADDMWGVDPAKLVPVLVKALQEALARIEALEAK
jgi:hypothetical protein